jgi:PAS domain-containing protein
MRQAPRFRKLTHEVFQGKPGTLTFQITGIKGRRLWLDTHAVPLRNDKEEIIALLGITRDVTDKKKVEEDLKKERDFVSTVLNTVETMIVVLDRDGRIVRFNRSCEQVSGYTFEEVQGRFVWDFLIPPEQTVLKKFLALLRPACSRTITRTIGWRRTDSES